jgi:hypothetical protein
MSLNNLLKVNTVTYTAPNGQDKTTGGLKYDDECEVLGRFGENTTRFDTQESIDQISEASFTSFESLVENGKITFCSNKYLIVDKQVIRKGNGKISHYNYTLKSLDNSNA